MIKRISEPKILIYDDENIEYLCGNSGIFSLKSGAPIEFSSIDDFNKQYLPPMYNFFECEVPNFEQLDNIKLDDTTMKRIAKFNKEADIKKLDKTIKEKEDKIKELDDVLQDKEGRIKKLKEFVAKIYDIDIEYDEDYDYYDD